MFHQAKKLSLSQDKERGFTVVEMAVVFLIIAILAALFVPQILTYMRQYRLGVAGRNVATALQRARYIATSNNVRAGISIPNLQQIDIQQFPAQAGIEPELKGTVHLPEGILLSEDYPKQIAFDGRGILTPMPKESPTIKLNGSDGYYVIITISPTGQIRVSDPVRRESD
jgi:type II secretory pathway pseudopilin PulG